MCSEHLQEGICRQQRCQQRHPRDCWYWTSKQEGCKIGESCQYIHVDSKRYSGERSENHRTLYTVYEDCEDVTHGELDHTNDYGEENEENYFVTRRNGDSLQFEFVCKICDSSFSSQKAVIQHDVMKHRHRATEASESFY